MKVHTAIAIVLIIASHAVYAENEDDDEKKMNIDDKSLQGYQDDATNSAEPAKRNPIGSLINGLLHTGKDIGRRANNATSSNNKNSGDDNSNDEK